MKNLITLTVLILVSLFVFESCKKEDAKTNKPPIARAGVDVIDTLSCYESAILTKLDGSGSSDPDNYIAGYKWLYLSGPPGSIVFTTPVSGVTRIENLPAGIHAFELTVTDEGGLSSKDTVLVTILGNSGNPKEYNLNLAMNIPYGFWNDYNDNYNDPPGFYYDYTGMYGMGTSPPLGDFNVGVYQYVDSVESSNVIYSSIVQIISRNRNPQLILTGDLLGVNFRNLIRAGGGPFSGTFKVLFGSANTCNPNVVAILPPLTVDGVLNVTTNMVNLSIRGKAFF